MDREMISTIIGALSTGLGMLLGFLLELCKDKVKQKRISQQEFLTLKEIFCQIDDVIELLVECSKKEFEISKLEEEFVNDKFFEQLYKNTKEKIQYFKSNSLNQKLRDDITKYLSMIYGLKDIKNRVFFGETFETLLDTTLKSNKIYQNEIINMIKKEFKIK